MQLSLTYTLDENKNLKEETISVPEMTGAAPSKAGAAGLVPAPAAGKQGSYLMGNGTWGRDADVLAAISAGQIGDAATVNEAADLDEYQTQGTYYFVWHSGNEHFPVEVGGYLIVVTGKGSSLVRQLYLSNHAAKAEIYTRLCNAGTWGDWCKIINHKDTMTGATASQAGAVGLVLAPAAGKQGSYLMGDGTWGRDADVLAAIAAGQIIASKSVGGDVDLNDYTAQGQYYITTNSANHQNVPFQSNGEYAGGYLIVIRGVGANYLRQIYITNTDAMNIYTRRYNGSAWGTWKRVTAGGECAPMLQSQAGVGQWTGINIETTADSFTLPSGGTWAYAALRGIVGNGSVAGVGGMFCGIAAGGSVIAPLVDTDYTTNRWSGFCLRIA